ncbi:phage major capsid protein, P2 family [Providencia rettgeri]|uniref:phage major capsid protein, P2 family n=2 Tax=Providencia TaxID=586 RepID=UPI00244BBE93|nr:phage major capsid protein, P2 family [Providencia rettgeri]MDH2396979.1 phage major capsid protein, P2 family [Providencia rettgeri]
MFLNNTARTYLKSHKAGLERSYNIDDASKYFAITEPKEIALRKAIMESVEFLNLIYCADVDQLAGQVISVGNPGLFTGRKKGGRFMRETGIDGNEYKLAETDSGAFLPWDVLSVWANSGGENEFYQRMQNFVNESFALDMLRIGFNGTHVADSTDAKEYPNGEDVNKGWHQIAKEWDGGKQVISESITLDEKGDFRSLDAMAQEVVNTCIPVQYRTDPRLVVLVGADLVAAEQHRLYQAADRPTEKIAAQLLGTTIAGRAAYIPPFMPGKRLVVTTLSNLHLYTQRNTRQRKAEFVDDRKQYENNYLRNEGYALEYPELYGAIDESAVTIGELVEPKDTVETE